MNKKLIGIYITIALAVSGFIYFYSPTTSIKVLAATPAQPETVQVHILTWGEIQ